MSGTLVCGLGGLAALPVLVSNLPERGDRCNTFTCAGVCWGMLAHAGVCWRMLAYAGVCWRMLMYADVCWRMLMYADVC